MKMLNKFFISNILSVASGLILLCAPLTAEAQQCNAAYEMMTKLYHPDPGSYTVWNVVYGTGEHEERFVTGLNWKDDGIVALAEVSKPGQPEASIVFVTYDRRGRKVAEHPYKIKGLKEIVKLVPVKSGYILLGNIMQEDKRAAAWIGFFDSEFQFIANKTISDKAFHLRATDIAQSKDEQQWMVSVTGQRYSEKSNELQDYKTASLYVLDKNGNELSSRSYILGLNSEILSLSSADFEREKSGFIATGYFENSFKKKVGWVMRLNPDGSLIWQKEFNRGNSAMIRKGIGYRDHDIVALGDIEPANSDPKGSWVTMLDGNSGQIMWQRYYYGETGHHDYIAQDLFANDDGLITLMMMAKSKAPPMEMDSEEDEEFSLISDMLIPENMDYAHLLTLTPRGVTISGDSYYFGQGVSMTDMNEYVNGNRIMAGYAVVPAEDLFQGKIVKHEPEEPLRERGALTLPDAELSDKTKKGLEMLKNRMGQGGQSPHLLEPEAGEEEMAQDESAKPKNQHVPLTKKAWLAIGEGPDAYTDPCAPIKKTITQK